MKLLSVLFYILFPLQLLAQVLPMEKIFFCSQQSSYNVGDTMHVEGQVMTCDTLQMPYSRYLYVEFFNHKDSLILRQKLRCKDNGYFMSDIPIHIDLENGIYYLRAFTKLMQNFPTETFPIFPICVGKSNVSPQRISAKNDLFCQFFPEGGHLGTDVAQNVAIYLTDKNRAPVSIPFAIVNERGDTIQRKQTTLGGWAIASLMPKEEGNYHLYASYKGEEFMFLFPENRHLPLIQGNIHRKSLHYRILASDESVSNGKVYLYNSYVGLCELPFPNGTGIVDLEGIPESAILIFLTNNNGTIISQSAQWYGKSSVEDIYSLRTIYAPGELLPIERSNTTSTFYVRIEPNDGQLGWLYRPQAENVLHLENDFTSIVPVPISYVSSNTKARDIDMRGWLYSACFHRFDLQKLLKDGFTYAYKPERNLSLNGIVSTTYGNPLKNGSILAMNYNEMLTYHSDLEEDGSFTMPIDDYNDKSTFFIQARNEKGEENLYEYVFSNDTFPEIRNWNKVRTDTIVMAEYQPTFNEFSFESNNLLPELIVKGTIYKDEPVRREEYYGIRFIGGEALEKKHYKDFEAMMSYFHSFVIVTRKDAGDEFGTPSIGINLRPDEEPREPPLVIYSRRFSVLEPKSMKVIIDGSLYEADEANKMLDMNMVEYVELLPPIKALKYIPGAIDGAIFIKTKGYKEEKREAKGIYYTPPLGIANLGMDMGENKKYNVPMIPGEYNLYLDVIDENKQIRSYLIPIEVKNED